MCLPDYEQAKKSIYRTAGYEEGYGIGQITVEAASGEEILRNFLGLGSGLRVSRFTITSSRFGLTSPEPEVDASAGIVHITPDPAAAIEIRLRSHLRPEPIILSGKVYGAGLPMLPPEQKRLRFSAEFFEVLWSAGTKSECSAHLEPHEKKDLATIENFATLNEWFDAGTIDIQVWCEGKRAIGGTLRLEEPNPRLDWPKVAAAARVLRSIAGPVDQERIRVSLHDLSAASGLRTFSDVAGAGSFRVEFEPSAEAPPQFSTVLYWFHVDVAEHVFYALVERRVIEDIVIEGRRRVTADKLQRIEAYVLTNPAEADRKMMRDDYDRYFARQEQSGCLGLGDLREFIAASAASQSPRA